MNKAPVTHASRIVQMGAFLSPVLLFGLVVTPDRAISSQPLSDRFRRGDTRMSSSSGRAVVGDRTQEQARPCPIIESEKSCPFRRIELAMTPSRVGSGFELTDEGAPVAVVQ
jgi:hypothetical protein